ncbi:MAG TPA: hypothetical protein VF749_06445 [Candidatus Acidoferrum sp.]
MFHNSDNGVDLGRHRVRIFDQEAGAIEYKVSFIRDVGFTDAIYSNRWRKAECVKRVAYKRRGHRDYFHRQRESTKLIDLFGFVGDYYETFGRAGHDLFAQEFATPTLYQGEARRNFVGSVHCKIKDPALFESDEGYPIASPQPFAIVRTGYSTDL